MRKRICACLVIALIVPAAARAQLGVDADTVALWHLDDGAGLVAASTPAGLDFALQRYPADGSNGSLIPTFATGCFGGALHFEHGTSYIYGGFGQTAQGFDFAQNTATLELMLETTSTDHGYLFVGGSIQFAAWKEADGQVGFWVGDGNNWGPIAISGETATVNDGLWHYVAFTYDGAQERVFVDGTMRAEMPFTGTIGAMSNFLLGGRGSNTFFAGEIDEVRLSSTARGAAEIATTATQLLACPEATPALAGVASLATLTTLRRRRAA